MAKVTILLNNQPVEVDESRPGLFGELGYKYVTPTTTPAATTTATTTITPPAATVASDIEAQLRKLQDEVAARQRVIQEALNIGLKPNEPIPAEILNKEPLLANLTPPSPTSTPSQVASQLLAGTAQASDVYKALIESYQKSLDAARTDYQNLLAKAETQMENRPTYAQIESEARQAFLQRYGLPSDWESTQIQTYLNLQSEVANLNQQLTDLNNREQQALAAVAEKPVAMPLITAEQAAIQRQFAIEKSALSAQLSAKAAAAELYRGNLDLANQYVDKYIQAATYQYEQQKADIQWLLSEKKDELQNLDAKTRTALQDILAYTEKQQDLAQQQLQLKWSYIIDAASKGVYIDPTNIDKKSIEELTKEYARKISAAVQQQQATATTQTLHAQLFNEFLPQIEEFIIQEPSVEGKRINWTILRNRWIQRGGSANQFDSLFKTYNPYRSTSASTTAIPLSYENL